MESRGRSLFDEGLSVTVSLSNGVSPRYKSFPCQVEAQRVVEEYFSNLPYGSLEMMYVMVPV